jgi:hypothetical protein
MPDCVQLLHNNSEKSVSPDDVSFPVEINQHEASHLLHSPVDEDIERRIQKQWHLLV